MVEITINGLIFGGWGSRARARRFDGGRVALPTGRLRSAVFEYGASFDGIEAVELFQSD